LSKGKYKFYVSALDCNLYLDTCEIKKLSLIIGNGGQANIHIDNNFTASKHVTVCQFNNETYTRYVYWFLKTNINLLERLFKGGCMKWLNKNNMKSIDIPIPPQETQTQTVQTLDDLANLRQNYMDIRDGLERRMKYYFEMMIKRHRGEITMEKLGDVCKIEGGSQLSKKNYVEGPYPVIGGGQSPAGYHNEYNKEANTILCSQSGSYSGFISRYPTSVWASDCFGIKPNDNIEQSYLFYYLKNIQHNIYKLQSGAGQPHVYSKDIINLDILYPPQETQTQIVQYLDNLEAEKNKITETLHQLDTEMREILTQSYQ
jgi:type I restriction enzyme M protein